MGAQEGLPPLGIPRDALRRRVAPRGVRAGGAFAGVQEVRPGRALGAVPQVQGGHARAGGGHDRGTEARRQEISSQEEDNCLYNSFSYSDNKNWQKESQ